MVPTLAADRMLLDCVHSLEEQTLQDFTLVVVDNSAQGLVAKTDVVRTRAVVVENQQNVGFGAAINQGFEQYPAPFVATLNDDAVAHCRWLEGLYEAMVDRPEVGMAASRVALRGQNALDSAGMLIAPDGSSKQRGHGRPLTEFGCPEEALLPSGSAAMYRGEMMQQLGGFDESFFLYCEDTDLGLRARRAGWCCVYVPGAQVDHQYSHSAGRASSLKAYYVERNRLLLVLKNFPWSMVPRAMGGSVVRYFWHLLYSLQGKGAAGAYRQQSGQSALTLAYFVFRAHISALTKLGRLLRSRREIRSTSRMTDQEFQSLLDRYQIGLREVAAL